MNEQPAITPDDSAGSFGRVVAEFRAMVLTGTLLGALVGGVGGRLAMYVLRLTSPDTVRGVTSDDGFQIGRFTPSGSYSLLVLGAAIGLIGAASYAWVAPWLIGPVWFRRATAAVGAGAVVGSMLVHADGVDFQLLGPTWLAIALFIAIPALFGALVGVTFDRFRCSGASRSGPRRWIPVVLALAVFPGAIPVAIVVALALVAGWAWRATPGLRRLQDRLAYGVAVRTAWMAVAVVGLVALVGDITAIY